MSQLNDLDNNLAADEFSSFDSTSTRTASLSTIGQQLTPIGQPTVTPRSNTQPTTEPVSQPRTPQLPTNNLADAPLVSAPRPNPYAATTDSLATPSPTVVEQPTYDQPIFGGGGGGGAAQRTSEEEIIEETPMVEEKKILGMKPKLFYGLLLVASIGGYFYFKSKSNLKTK